MNSTNSSPHVDTVVVGGGMAGLAAAAYVGGAGKSVIVLERSSHTGGRAITEERNGYYFNLGPHALYKEGLAAQILRELGVAVRGGEPPIAGKAALNGELHTLPASPIGMLTTSLFGLGAKLEMGRIFATFPRQDAQAYANISLEEWLASKVSRPEVRQLFVALVRLATYTNDPARVSAGLAIAQLQMALKGVLYLDRGWQTLVDGLRTASEEAGPVRVATLDIGLSETPRPNARFVLGIDQPLYLSIHSGVGDLAPAGGTMLHVAKYLGNGASSAEEVEQELEALLDLAQPGWRDVVVERRFLPNLIAVNALATAQDGGLEGRPEVAAAMPGVYLAGDWVGSEGWLADAGLASAKRAAAAALEAIAAPARPVPAGVA